MNQDSGISNLQILQLTFGPVAFRIERSSLVGRK